ncbi:GTPase-associated system all-helical protein GASH [Hymenobacter sp. CRA2]|uniref:GTPase-associated system all-helical protein GASH n=1 Tax=Hymenobacter sp. CRA2 TaxID=1955620 RepID=UPI00098FD4F9|nr:GTPase-associated system all-helical protein GASH [Hymenobacter sp. CRA2]OON69968.1 hypothetical protein B0919_04260 [Hymenobacter sp. CRA2]
MSANPLFDRWHENDFFGIGDDDARRDQLLKAVADLGKIFKKTPSQIRCYTLVALDAHIAEDNALLAATYELIKKHWPGAGGRFKGTMPRQTVRGVMLSALYERASEDLTALKVLYYTASGYYPFTDFGAEKPVIDLLLEEFGSKLETQAIAEWSLDQAGFTPHIEKFQFSLSPAEVAVDKTQLEVLLKEAIHSLQLQDKYGTIRPQDEEGTAFGSKSAAAIGNAIEVAIKSSGKSLSTASFEAELNSFLDSVSKVITDTLTKSQQAMKAVERRSQLLWWKETLYSTTLRRSYRDLDVALLPAVMAVELAKLVPNTIPVSVDYLLTDTYRAVVSGKPAPQTLAELVAPFATAEHRTALRQALPQEMTACDERTTLTAFLTQVLHQRATPEQLQVRTGLRPDHPAAPDQLAVILLHDLLTDRLLSARS